MNEEAIQDLLEQIEGMLDEGLDKQLIWEMLQSSIISDQQLDILVGILEENKDLKELAEEIALGIHTPTLASDIARTQPYHANDVCTPADWQQPRRSQ